MFPHSEAFAEYAAAQTDTVLVAAVAERKIVVDKLYFSANVAGNFFLETGTTTKILPKQYQQGVALDEPYIRTVRGEALTITTTHVGDHSIYVAYHLEG